jgi:alanine racemase
MQKTLSIINLTAIRENTQKVLKMLNGKKLYAVVKADAYGHGALQVAQAIQDLVQGFCVAICDEGASLRIGGITKPILVFAPPLGNDDIYRAQMYNLTLTVNSKYTARLIKNLNCHIKINTGMNRYGCNNSDLYEIMNILQPEQIQGVYSHLYCAQSKKISLAQLKIFNDAVEKVKAKNPKAIAHIAASGGIISGGGYLCDCARCGIMLYGYTPAGFKKQDLTPALKVYAPLSQVTSKVGGGAGYNIIHKNYKKLLTVRAGYADGFIRKVPLGIKNLCMDAYVAKNNNVSGAITYMGQTYLPVLTDAEDYAKRCGTISYEVLCRATSRSLKIYER